MKHLESFLLFNGLSKIDNACKCLKKAEKNTRSTRAMKTLKTRFVQSYACHDKYDFVQKYSASTYNSTHPRYILPARINDSVRHDRVWYMIEKCDRRTLNEIVKHDDGEKRFSYLPLELLDVLCLKFWGNIPILL